jgi:hypothetical protein
VVWPNPEYSGLKPETTQIWKTKFVAPGLEDLLGETELVGIFGQEVALVSDFLAAHHELSAGDVQRKTAFGENKRRPIERAEQ